jgi:long-chain acyl-CoA synthetase
VQVWFPESWRSPDGQLQRFLPGIGKLLSETRAAAVPVYIDGTFEALPRGRRWPRPHAVRVVFGPAVSYDALRADAARDDDYDGIAAALRERLAALVPASVATMADAAE